MVVLLVNACKSTPQHTAVREPDGESVILVGTASLDSLRTPPFEDWFVPNYQAARTDPGLVAELSDLLQGVEIELFMGTWCEDSQREVPKFVRILEEAGYPASKVRVVAMTREKTTPQDYEAGLGITNVPTFIFYRDGEELNRIVEFPMESLEEDMLKILKGMPYKHAYDWE